MKRFDHYHVYVGLPGYLPNTNHACETKEEAIRIAKQEKAFFQDYGDSYLAVRVEGDIRKDGWYAVKMENDAQDGFFLWQTITIEPCEETDCRCFECGALFQDDGRCNCSWKED